MELRATRDEALAEHDWYLAAAAAEATGERAELLATLALLPDEAEIPRLRLGLAHTRLVAQTDPEAALDAATALDREAATLGERLGDPAVRVPTLELLVATAALAGLDAAVVQLAEALRAQALTAGLLENAVGAETLRAEALLRLDQPEPALEAARVAHGHGLRLEDRRWAARAAEARGVAARRLGRLLEAAESFDAALALSLTPAGPGNAAGQPHQDAGAHARLSALSAAAHLALGASPLAHLRELEALAAGADPEARAIAMAAIASATGATPSRRGHLADARAALEAGELEAALDHVADRGDTAAALIRAEALARRGDPVGAVAAADAALEAARAVGQGLDEATARVARSRHLLALGDLDGARADARVALSLARELENPALMASAALELGRGLLAGENVAAALEALAEIALACARMGAIANAVELAARRALTALEWSEAEVAHPALEALLAGALRDPALPPQGAARIALAWAASGMSDGRYEEARAQLSRAAALDHTYALGLSAELDRFRDELARREGGGA